MNDQQEAQPTPRGKTPATVLAAKGMSFKHAALGPRGAPPLPDPRLLEWVAPQTNKPAQHICLAYATTKQTRLTYLAQSWTEPRPLAADEAARSGNLRTTIEYMTRAWTPPCATSRRAPGRGRTP